MSTNTQTTAGKLQDVATEEEVIDKELLDDAPGVKYFLIETIEEYEYALATLEPVKALAIDIETYTPPHLRRVVPKDSWALNPHCSRISIISLCVEGQDRPVLFDIRLLEEAGYDPTIIWEFLKSRELLIAHNAKFELKHLFQTYGEWLENMHCTAVMSYCLANATGSKCGRDRGHGLKDLCRDWLDIPLAGKGKEQITDWYPRPVNKTTELIWEAKLAYAANDTLYLFPLYRALHKSLTDPLPKTSARPDWAALPPYGLGQARVLDLEFKALVPVAMMEYNGLPTNPELVNLLQLQIQDKRYTTGKLYEVGGQLAEHLGLGVCDTLFSPYPIPYPQTLKDFQSPIKLIEHLKRTTGFSKLTNAQSETIKRFIEVLDGITDAERDPTFVDESEEELYSELFELEQATCIQSSKTCKLVVEFKMLLKQASMNLIKYIMPLTNSIHSGINQVLAATGRTSSSSPNSQNINGKLEIEIEIEKPEDLLELLRQPQPVTVGK